MGDDLESLLESLVPGAARGMAASLDDPPFPTDLDLTPRGILGRGGAGVVYEAWDPVVERTVAVKISRPELGAAGRKALLDEARRAASVAHPAVLPLLEVRAANHLLCLITPVAPGDSLRGRWDDEQRDLAQEVVTLRAIASALAAAHRASVVHGDVHPGNIGLGEQGEPYLLDWAPLDAHATSVTGHLGYAAPEVLRGEPPSQASDMWSLGAILYEALTERPVRPRREGEGAADFVRRWQQAPEPDPPDDAPELPGLRSLLIGLLRGDVEARTNAQDATTALARVVTGQSERNRRARRARALHQHAREQMELIESLDDRVKREHDSLRVQRSRIPGHAPVSQKRPVWDAEDRLEELEVERFEAWWYAVEAAAEAFFIAPAPGAPRQTLAQLWWRALKDAEQTGQKRTVQVARHRVQTLDDGPLRTLLDAPGHVSLQADRPDATVEICRVEPKGRRLQPVTSTIMPMPLIKHTLAQGSWLLTVRAPGCVAVPVPIRVRRLHHHRGRVAVHTAAQVGEGYVPMAEGPFVLGGDPQARQPLTASEPFLGHRFVKRTLVTTAEWKAFLDDLPIDEAREHVPGEAGLFGGFRPAWTHAEHGWSAPQGWEQTWPIFSIHMGAMLAYAAWRSDLEGRTVRLLTEEEWEKAARGADGRAYPWGDGFDPTWCHMRQSRPGSPMPCPVESYPVDTSVYGCADMAGLLRELTSSAFDDGQQVIRGGTWGDDADDCRCACRAGIQPIFRSSFVGFRLIADEPIGD